MLQLFSWDAFSGHGAMDTGGRQLKHESWNSYYFPLLQLVGISWIISCSLDEELICSKVDTSSYE